VISIVSIVIIVGSYNSAPAPTTTPATITPAPTTTPVTTPLAPPTATKCCPANYIKDGIYCREACPEKYKLNGALCVQECPEGYIDKDGFCTKMPDIYSKGCCCNFITKECCNNCKEGYIDQLCNCYSTGNSYMKSIYPAKSLPISSTTCT